MIKTRKVNRTKKTASPAPLHAARGFFALLTPAIAVTAISMSAATMYVTATAKPTVNAALTRRAPIMKTIPVVPKTSISQALDRLKLKIPDFVANGSPIPNLKINAFNIPLAQLPGKGMMQNFSVDKDVAYKGGQVKVEVPEIDISKFMPQTTGAPPASVTQPSTGTPTTVPSTTTGSSGQPASANEVNATNCAQFSGMPSAQYCSQAGQGADLCTRCKAAGM